jgi:hypothetical protein
MELAPLLKLTWYIYDVFISIPLICISVLMPLPPCFDYLQLSSKFCIQEIMHPPTFLLFSNLDFVYSRSFANSVWI